MNNITRYFKVEKENELAGLFNTNNQTMLDAQIKLLSDMTVTEVTESEYRQLQAKAEWNNSGNNTDPKIQEIKERHAAATPGPWKFIDLGEDREYALFGRDGVHGTRILDFGSAPDIYDQSCGQCPNSENEALIENAPEDIAYLLSEIERLQGQVGQMAETLEFYEEEGNYLEYIIGWGPEIPVVKDGGKRARTALSHLKG